MKTMKDVNIPPFINKNCRDFYQEVMIRRDMKDAYRNVYGDSLPEQELERIVEVVRGQR